MTITSIGSRSSLAVQSLVDMRRQLDELQRQLGSGKKADSYAGLGLDSGFVVGLRGQVSAIAAYGDTITNVGVRLDLAQSPLGRLGDITPHMKTTALTQNVLANGTTIAQSTAMSQLDEMLGLLNTRAGDRYLFSGRAADQPAVETLDHVMNGDGARAGFKQVTAERKQADLGANGLGRLTISPPPPPGHAVVTVAEDAG